MTLSAEVLAELGELDTPTVCNALEVVAPQRRGFGFSTQPFFCADEQMKPIVGFARTGTIRSAATDGRSAQESLAMRLGYYAHIAKEPAPTITVIEDLDPQPGCGAWWGEVNSNIHAGLGSLGVITNGSIRDLDDWVPGFGALAGSVGPSHMWVHVVSFGEPVSVHGMRVAAGDLIHADRHGAVVVPLDVAGEVAAAAAKIAQGERRLIDAAQADGFNIERLSALLNPAGDDH